MLKSFETQLYVPHSKLVTFAEDALRTEVKDTKETVRYFINIDIPGSEHNQLMNGIAIGFISVLARKLESKANNNQPGLHFSLELDCRCLEDVSYKVLDHIYYNNNGDSSNVGKNIYCSNDASKQDVILTILTVLQKYLEVRLIKVTENLNPFNLKDWSEFDWKDEDGTTLDPAWQYAAYDTYGLHVFVDQPVYNHIENCWKVATIHSNQAMCIVGYTHSNNDWQVTILRRPANT